MNEPRDVAGIGRGARSLVRAGVLAAVAALALSACGGNASGGSTPPATKSGDNVPPVSDVGPRSFASAGPFTVGVTTLALPGDKAPVEVWYPAATKPVAGAQTASYNVEDYLPPALQKLFPPGFQGGVYDTDAYRDVAIASGRFPLVEFTHGYAGFRTQSTFLTTHLASWGFVVAAPDLLDNDLTAVLSGKQAEGSGADIAEAADTITLMGQQNQAPSGRFSGHLDMSRVAAIGHSLGGAVSEGVAASDPAVTTFIGMAGATVGSFGQASTGPGSAVPDKPGMLMVGTADGVADPAGIARAYTAMKQPKRFVTLQNFGHLVFADICRIGADRGGLAGLAAGAGLSLPGNLKKLATDGCDAPDTPVTQGWPVIRQAVVAQLRHVFGFDPTEAALTGLGSAYPAIVAVDTDGASASS
ncbi:MAG: alpha/beta hydrolase family protein [Mycobacteriales bacterium]